MASLYKRDGSPFWWVKYRDAATGKIKREPTGFRVGVGVDTQRARQLRDEKSLAESQTNWSGRTGEAWETWVPDYLVTKYGGNERTCARMKVAWKFASVFLKRKEIQAPRHLTREHCLAFVVSRKEDGMSHNGALFDLQLLGHLVNEAVRRGFAQSNPAAGLRIKREKVAQKAELSDADIEKVRAGIAALPDTDRNGYPAKHMHRVSFEISLAQGCRLFETWLDVQTDVNLESQTVQFRAKGKYYTTELNPALIPLMEELRAAGRRKAYDLPPGSPEDSRVIAAAWSRLLHDIGLGHLCFHSLRVTCISRLHRAGVPESVAMQLVGHASATVHRVYRRVKQTEGRSAWAAYNKTLVPSVKAADLTQTEKEKVC